jgi:type II secretory pathway pseudopilin PulG
MRISTLQKGFGIIEIIIGVAIITISLLGVMLSAKVSFQIISENLRRVQANFLAEEGIEALKSIRDDGWTANIVPITTGTDYHLVYDTGANEWTLVAGALADQIDGVFTRTVQLNAVDRDVANGTQDIVFAGGIADAGTRKVTVTISWPGRSGTKTQAISTYMTNIFAN